MASLSDVGASCARGKRGQILCEDGTRSRCIANIKKNQVMRPVGEFEDLEDIQARKQPWREMAHYTGVARDTGRLTFGRAPPILYHRPPLCACC
jgi:hypothetical protein